MSTSLPSKSAEKHLRKEMHPITAKKQATRTGIGRRLNEAACWRWLHRTCDVTGPLDASDEFCLFFFMQ